MQDLILGGPDGSFEPVQMSYGYACDSSGGCFVQLVWIDVSGPLACRVGENFEVLPANAGTFVATAVRIDAMGSSCPVGDYLIEPVEPSNGWTEPSSCAPDLPTFLRDVESSRSIDSCSVMRQWDYRGVLTSTESARSGLVSIRQAGDACVFNAEIVFADQPDLVQSFQIPVQELPNTESLMICVDN